MLINNNICIEDGISIKDLYPKKKPGNSGTVTTSNKPPRENLIFIKGSGGNFSEWLASQEPNNPNEPYYIALELDFQSQIGMYNTAGSLGYLLTQNNNKYVDIDLDLSNNTFTTFGNVYTFYNCTNLVSITLPETFTTFYNGEFWGCTGLTSINIPNGVTNISDQLFRGCTSLISIIIPDSVTNIGVYVFYGCTSLSSVILSKNLPYIQNYTFSDCTSLTSITIPSSVTSIGTECFKGCTNLISITCERTTPPSLGTNAFQNTPANLQIKVPAESVAAYKAAYGWSSYADKIVAI